MSLPQTLAILAAFTERKLAYKMKWVGYVQVYVRSTCLHRWFLLASDSPLLSSQVVNTVPTPLPASENSEWADDGQLIMLIF